MYVQLLPAGSYDIGCTPAAINITFKRDSCPYDLLPEVVREEALRAGREQERETFRNNRAKFIADRAHGEKFHQRFQYVRAKDEARNFVGLRACVLYVCVRA